MTDLFDQILLTEQEIQLQRRDAIRALDADITHAAEGGITSLLHLCRQLADELVESRHPSPLCNSDYFESERAGARFQDARDAVIAVLKQAPDTLAAKLPAKASLWLDLQGRSMSETAVRNYLREPVFIADICREYLNQLPGNQRTCFVGSRLNRLGSNKTDKIKNPQLHLLAETASDQKKTRK